MNARNPNSKHLLWLSLLTALIFGGHAPAFAAESGQRPSWQFWNNANQNLPAANNTDATLAPDLTRDQNSLRSDRQNLAAAYQSLREHQRSGADTTADLQNIQSLKQSYANDLEQYKKDGGQANYGGGHHSRRYKHRHHQDH